MKTLKRKTSLQRRGAALALVMVAVVVLLVVGTGLLNLGLHGRTFAMRTGDEIEARCAADAGLTKALFEMNQKLQAELWDDLSLPEAADELLAHCDAVIDYSVTGDFFAGYSVEATGKSGRATKTIGCSLPLQGLFEYAIYAKNDLDLKNSASIDWYNYDDDDDSLKIGTGSTAAAVITLKNEAIINGDVVVGVGGNPDVVIQDNGATIAGETYAETEETPLPSITLPGWLESLPSGGTIENDTTITAAAGKYDEIDLKNGKKIKVEGNITLYIIGDITLDNSTEIEVDGDSGSSLVLYIGGNFEGKNGSTLNNKTEDAAKLKIYGLDSCQNMLFKNSSELYGAIYAPNADVIFYNSAAAYGAVVAKTFEQKNSADFNYDAALRDVTVDDEGVRFVAKRWQEQ